MTIRSDIFDDIYFSPDDGLAETGYVFLKHNNLPQAFSEAFEAGRKSFVIGETGFGTGLNVLAAWEMFEERAPAGQRLHILSFEKYPLPWEKIEKALAPWQARFSPRMSVLKERYPLRIPGFHPVRLSERVTLTLVFDDVNEALPKTDVPGGVDAWFLDGFAPSKNPGIWTQTVFDNMARLSHQRTSFATFTAAGAVRRGLQAAGFGVEKVPGFGKKREMITGRFKGGAGKSGQAVYQRESGAPDKARVAIIGGGLSGTAAAYIFGRRGITPVIFEAAGHLAAGASGNEVGLVNPRLSKLRDTQADFYMTAWEMAVRSLRSLQKTRDIGFAPCGSLHLMTDETKRDRYPATYENWGWPDDRMRLPKAGEAAAAAGIKSLPAGALHLPDAAIVSPRALCEAYASGCEVRLNAPVKSLAPHDGGWRVNGERFEAVVLASGLAVQEFCGLDWLPLHSVRGQITRIGTTPNLSGLSAALCYGGYCSPCLDGHHYIGATFQPWLKDPAPRVEDDEDNIAKLRAVLDSGKTPGVQGHRAAFRTSSKDRFPVIGPVPDIKSWKAGGEGAIPGLYVSTGHGSHGIIASLLGAVVIADHWQKTPHNLARHVRRRLAPARFLKRRRRRGQL